MREKRDFRSLSAPPAPTSLSTPPRLSIWKETLLAKREETLEAKANKETEKERRRQTDLEGEWATDRKDNICSELRAATIY